MSTAPKKNNRTHTAKRLLKQTRHNLMRTVMRLEKRVRELEGAAGRVIGDWERGDTVIIDTGVEISPIESNLAKLRDAIKAKVLS